MMNRKHAAIAIQALLLLPACRDDGAGTTGEGQQPTTSGPNTGSDSGAEGTTTGSQTVTTAADNTGTGPDPDTGSGGTACVPPPYCGIDFRGFRCTPLDAPNYQPEGYTCCPDDYANPGITRCFCDEEFEACLPPASQIPMDCLETSGGQVLCETDPGDPDWDCCALDEPDGGLTEVCWPAGTSGPTGYTCAGGDTSTTGASSDSSGGNTEPCPGHRQYQCLARKYGVYERESDGSLSWAPPALTPEPIECFPANGYDPNAGSNPGLYGDPIVVCAPEALGDLGDASDPMVEVIRGLCLQECEARPLPTQIVPTYIQGGTFTWNLVNTVCEIGPELSQFNGEGLSGGALPCDVGGTQLADVGECDGAAGEPTECPVGNTTLCQDWRPDLWVFSSTDRAGNVVSVIDEDFFEEISLGTGFACDAPAFVFSADGTTVSTIDGVLPNDLYERLGLVDGDNSFDLRVKTQRAWTDWFDLNTYADAFYAFSSLESKVPTEFELRYESVVSNGTVTRNIKLADCTAAGDSWRCDRRDL